jgi:hypothetical protein
MYSPSVFPLLWCRWGEEEGNRYREQGVLVGRGREDKGEERGYRGGEGGGKF